MYEAKNPGRGGVWRRRKMRQPKILKCGEKQEATANKEEWKEEMKRFCLEKYYDPEEMTTG